MAVVTLSNPSYTSPSIPSNPGNAAVAVLSDVDTYDVGVNVFRCESGTLVVRPAAAPLATVTLPAWPAGAVVPFEVCAIMSTGTTAGNIIICY